MTAPSAKMTDSQNGKKSMEPNSTTAVNMRKAIYLKYSPPNITQKKKSEDKKKRVKYVLAIERIYSEIFELFDSCDNSIGDKLWRILPYYFCYIIN